MIQHSKIKINKNRHEIWIILHKSVSSIEHILLHLFLNSIIITQWNTIFVTKDLSADSNR